MADWCGIGAGVLKKSHSEMSSSRLNNKKQDQILSSDPAFSISMWLTLTIDILPQKTV